MSPINAFSVEELYTLEFSDSFQENTGYWQEPNPHESSVEQVTTSPLKKKKPARARQKRIIQSDDAPRQIAKHGKVRKQDSFWCEVLQYIESKTKQYGRRTYDMVCGKWKTMRPVVIRFCGVYGKVMRMSQESEAGDEDYIKKAMIHYQAETGLSFKYRHCWEVLKDSLKWQEIPLPKLSRESEGDSKRHKSSGSSSFNTEFGDASINLNTNAGDNDEDEVQEIRRPEGRDTARAARKNKGSKALG
ncbi:glutathione S-transferase T3-like protein [Tanacetum coccineum]